MPKIYQRFRPEAIRKGRNATRTVVVTFSLLVVVSAAISVGSVIKGAIGSGRDVACGEVARAGGQAALGGASATRLQPNANHVPQAEHADRCNPPCPIDASGKGDAEGPVHVTVDVVEPGSLSRKTHLRVTVISHIELKELRVTPLPPAGFERTTDKWSFKPTRGQPATHDFYLQMKKYDRHFVKVAWAALLPTGELWIGDEGVTVHRELRAPRALGFTRAAPSGERRIHVRAVKRERGER